MPNRLVKRSWKIPSPAESGRFGKYLSRAESTISFFSWRYFLISIQTLFFHSSSSETFFCRSHRGVCPELIEEACPELVEGSKGCGFRIPFFPLKESPLSSLPHPVSGYKIAKVGFLLQRVSRILPKEYPLPPI